MAKANPLDIAFSQRILNEGYRKPQSLSLRDELRRLEYYLIALALRDARYNRENAAKLLGICRSDLVYKLKAIYRKQSVRAVAANR